MSLTKPYKGKIYTNLNMHMRVVISKFLVVDSSFLLSLSQASGVLPLSLGIMLSVR